jgi:hypothetical protein
MEALVVAQPAEPVQRPVHFMVDPRLEGEHHPVVADLLGVPSYGPEMSGGRVHGGDGTHSRSRL